MCYLITQLFSNLSDLLVLGSLPDSSKVDIGDFKIADYFIKIRVLITVFLLTKATEDVCPSKPPLSQL